MSNAFIHEIGKIRVKASSNRKPHFRVISWIEGAPLPDGSRGTSLTFILPTRACKFAEAKHGGCSMCGYPNENPPEPPQELLETLPAKLMEIFETKKVAGPMVVKFFTSGSFLDRLELPVHIREKILSNFAQIEQIKEIIIESRAEYVIRRNLESITKVADPSKLTIAIGLETADDDVNKRSINKGMTWKQFTRAIKLSLQHNVRIKAYVLLKPLFVSEIFAVKDALRTAKKAAEIGVESISINSSNIQRGTLMEKLFFQQSYRPPWLWSSLFVTRRIKQEFPNIRVICDPVASGHERGPHNCGRCDDLFKKALSEFSYTQDLAHLTGLSCQCLEQYKTFLTSEQMNTGFGVCYDELRLNKGRLKRN